ncbi:MAG: hypothetical protein AAGI10_03190 [Pseudomonadota bacterium]
MPLPPLCEVGESFAEIAPDYRRRLAAELYGDIPAPPDTLRYECKPLPTSGAQRLTLSMGLPAGVFEVDTALWLPQGDGPFPLICGLDFVGPAGLLFDDEFPLDPDAVIVARPEFGSPDGVLRDTLRGTSAPNWPVSLLTAQGYAVMVSCYGSWVPDQAEACKKAGLMPLIEGETGAISLWAWAIQRMVDVAETLDDIDSGRITVAGHSRLGKAALWASAEDARILTVFASSSGAAGAAPACHGVGETLVELHDRFPHWLRPGWEARGLTTDQHALIALSCPGSVYLAAAEDDLWADPLGSYAALVVASSVWPDIDAGAWPQPEAIWRPGARVANGHLGYHLRAGGHALLPYDWHLFLEFLSGQAPSMG